MAKLGKLTIAKQVHEVTGGTQLCATCNRTSRYTLALTCWEVTWDDRFWRLGRKIHRTCTRCGTTALLKQAPAGETLDFPLLGPEAKATGAAAAAAATAPPPEEFGGGAGRVVDREFLALMTEAVGLLQTDVGADYQEAIYNQAHAGVWGLLYDYAGSYAKEWLRKLAATQVAFDRPAAERALTRTLFDAALEGYILYWLEAVHRQKGARHPRPGSADRFIAQVNPRAYRLAERAQNAYDPAVLYLMWERADRALGDALRYGVPQLSKVRKESVRQVLWLYCLGYGVGCEEHRLEGV